ncbi:hypothetical protein [Alteromonas sp. a30]|uniref:hypothetical protein n=1 Tax=Alteromonas sp. a30 TaxID=2730917 RepID=UPI0022807225|nr:hypothetical protein [Alteromonas sp. a30]MCY7295332.1 hypothetical protein [Alteromonas sp. a30]
MGDWGIAIVFGLMVAAFSLGLTSIITGFLKPSEGVAAIQHRVEYGFFGAAGLVVAAVLAYAILTA